MLKDMAAKCTLLAFLVLTIVNRTVGVPLDRTARSLKNNEIGYRNEEKTPPTSTVIVISKDLGRLETRETEKTPTTTTTTAAATKSNGKRESVPLDKDDDDGSLDSDFDDMQYASTNNGGSNLLSLFNLSGSLLPGLSGGTAVQNIMKAMVKDYLTKNPTPFLRRRNMADNEIEIESVDKNLTFGKSNELERDKNTVSNQESSQILESDKERNGFNGLAKEAPYRNLGSNCEKRQECKVSKKLESQKLESSEEEENDLFEGSNENNNNAAEESVESDENESHPKQIQSESDSKIASETEESSESDFDEPPGGGDGAGGGVLGFLAQFSGGEDGQSDLGSLLGAISGVVVNLSGDGIDVNNLVSSGLGLLAGLLSEGNENPGSVLASYLLTSLDTLTGGGANNNGAFFGNFISKLVKGSSAAGDESGSGGDSGSDSGSGSDEDATMDAGSDSFGFFSSLIMGLLGSMSKGSSPS